MRQDLLIILLLMEKMTHDTLFSFVVSHYATTDAHNDMLRLCIESIRNTHDIETPIHVIDSLSPIAYTDNDPFVYIHTNPFPEAGEVGALYWFSQNNVSRHAAVIHDSMRILHDISKYGTFVHHPIPMWHFEYAFQYHETQIIECIELIDPSDPIRSQRIDQFKNKAGITWTGCFGSSMLISHDRLNWYANTLDIFRPISIVRDKAYRQAYERILGLLLHENEDMPLRTSLCGHITQHSDQIETLSFVTLYNTLKACHYDYPAIKMWVGR